MQKSRRLYLLLGTNLGNRIQNILLAKVHLDAFFETEGKMSSLFETAAWGNTNQPGFINTALEYETHFEAAEILVAINKIEALLGRERIEKWGPRLIDIDILFLGNEIVKTENLQIPHAEIQNRRFALVPMHQLNPQFIHPVFNKNIAELLEVCPDNLKVKKC